MATKCAALNGIDAANCCSGATDIPRCMHEVANANGNKFGDESHVGQIWQKYCAHTVRCDDDCPWPECEQTPPVVDAAQTAEPAMPKPQAQTAAEVKPHRSGCACVHAGTPAPLDGGAALLGMTLAVLVGASRLRLTRWSRTRCQDHCTRVQAARKGNPTGGGVSEVTHKTTRRPEQVDRACSKPSHEVSAGIRSACRASTIRWKNTRFQAFAGSGICMSAKEGSCRKWRHNRSNPQPKTTTDKT